MNLVADSQKQSRSVYTSALGDPHTFSHELSHSNMCPPSTHTVFMRFFHYDPYISIDFKNAMNWFGIKRHFLLALPHQVIFKQKDCEDVIKVMEILRKL